ncbi:hypothetical protein AB1286_33165 [Trinickia sp. NRRL B-1857]|uniref:hypothetical protein n=1 Tax=Trinickia sp. NRRL B-1857 TaxID=3162879 RepID=UPI003D2E7E02
MAGPAMGLNVLANPLLATLDPDQQQSLMQLQQQQAIGQAMLGQGLQPLDTSNRQVGGMGYQISPLEGVSKLLNAYLGNKLMMGSLGQQAQLMSGMYRGAFGGSPQPGAASSPTGDSGGTFSMPQPAGADTATLQGPSAGMGIGQPTPVQLGQAMVAQTPQAAGSGAGPMTLPGYTPQDSMLLYAMLGPQEYGKLLEARTAPTDATRMAWAAGVDPRTANAGALFKNNFVAPITGTGIFRDPQTMQPTAFNPAVPDGATPLFDASGNVAAVQPLQGAAGVASTMAAAKTAGEGSQLPYAGVDAAGNPVPVTNRTAAANQGSTPAAAPTLPGIFAQQESSGGKTAPDNPYQIQQATFNRFAQPGESWGNPADRSAVAQRVLASYDQKYGGDLGRIATAYFSGEGNVAPAGSPTPFIKNTADASGKTVASYVGDILGRAGGSGFGGAPGGPIYASAPLGAGAKATADATNQSNELSQKWTALETANSKAQNTISYLQNIKTLASNAAVGPQSDRLNYINGLLSLAGSEKATDMVTANDLLNKYSGQITAGLSANGMGTDAARAILQSAYPSAHMNLGAINEAVDNLVGAQQMTQAKARLLAPLRNANDSAGYTNKELAFDQSADPRIFQYANIKDPSARQAFAKTLIQQDPTIPQKIQALQQLGVFK